MHITIFNRNYYSWFHFFINSFITFINFFFTYSKYSPISHDLSHSHLKLLGLQAYPLSHTPLSINSLQSHQHLSLFQCCLSLQTIESNLHSYLHVSCHFIFFISLVLDIKLNTLTLKSSTTSRTHIFVYRSLISLQLPLHLLVLTVKG